MWLHNKSHKMGERGGMKSRKAGVKVSDENEHMPTHTTGLRRDASLGDR